MTRAATFKQFIGDLPKNIFSGFVVSLIALPLGLGLAIASEAPPIAGIIAAIAGGMVVSILGGSHLTITGPGNGLVIVILSAIVGLGEEKPIKKLSLLAIYTPWRPSCSLVFCFFCSDFSAWVP